MTQRSLTRLARTAALIALTLSPSILHAQVSRAAGYTPPDDNPAIKVGVTWFGDFTHQTTPTVKDAAGNDVHLSSFNVTRTYINVTGNVSHMLAFRITPDIARETGTGPSLTGSLEFRLKYGFAQVNLDDWLPKGSWVRLGIQQTPYIDFIESIYRYRFQGATFTDREGFVSSSDAGISGHYNLPSNFGDFQVGVYNGETVNKPEVNDQKALEMRGTLRPFAKMAPVLRGIRATVFYDGDHYVQGAERKRTVGALTFEHPHLNAGFEYLNAKDQTLPANADVNGKGFSVFATPRTSMGLEALARYDQLKPNSTLDTQERKRTILGVAYWLPHTGGPASAFMIDYEKTNFDNFTPAQAAQGKISLHGLVNF